MVRRRCLIRNVLRRMCSSVFCICCSSCSASGPNDVMKTECVHVCFCVQVASSAVTEHVCVFVFCVGMSASSLFPCSIRIPLVLGLRWCLRLRPRFLCLFVFEGTCSRCALLVKQMLSRLVDQCDDTVHGPMCSDTGMVHSPQSETRRPMQRTFHSPENDLPDIPARGTMFDFFSSSPLLHCPHGVTMFAAQPCVSVCICFVSMRGFQSRERSSACQHRISVVGFMMQC